MMCESYRLGVKGFEILSGRTMSPHFHPEHISVEALHGIIGISKEAGELLDIVSRALFYDHPVDKAHVREEIGDIMWYLMAIVRAEGWEIEEILHENIEKLKKRYPEQFSSLAAFERKDKA